MNTAMTHPLIMIDLIGAAMHRLNCPQILFIFIPLLAQMPAVAGFSSLI
jgi:hypothetical protein